MMWSRTSLKALSLGGVIRIRELMSAVAVIKQGIEALPLNIWKK